MQQGLHRLNTLAETEARAELLKCCGSTEWANRIVSERPFHDVGQLKEAADRIWWSLKESDWLEAFSRHPKIGERKAAQPAPSDTGRWSQEEQSGTQNASSEILSELERANRAYEARFGYIFIVCATGKSSREMLSLLHERLQHDPETEIRIAAGEQNRITHLRLEKLLNSLESEA